MIPYDQFIEYSQEQMLTRSMGFYEELRRRRSVRNFSSRHVPREVIEFCIRAAGTAPSGANIQPWQFVVVSNPEVKHEIRIAAEKEEHEFYTRRATKEWLEKLSPLGTDENKEFLESAAYLIAIFVQSYSYNESGKRVKHYYALESVGISTGILITALHHAGLATLTHTPSPMKFLNKILKRPKNEKPFLLLVTGYPVEDASVPDIEKKSLDQFSTFI